RMAEEHPGLEQVTIDGVGHVPSLTEPESIDAIDRLLARVDAGTKKPAAEARPVSAEATV
ncbi:MAG: hypothetical protein AAF942_07735, partial [Pseudomonadota bacterium]